MFVEAPEYDLALRGLILGAAGLLWVTVLIRLNGLRSLSKMSNFDFVMTIALGSLLSGAARSSEWSGFAQALLGMMSLFALQWLMNKARMRSKRFESLVQNHPVILMRGGEFRWPAMEATRVTKSDILEKLRMSNATDFSRIHAVVLETTGDVSVLYGDGLDERLIEGLD
ncbi:MAG: DUF421 domain-containing protein [Erythrobacter sp.]|uniref:DUF421 domain-containing protein n=1 Tax=Erythrobacter sp. TaxID=1042 RepID=UPI0032EBB874